jgi:hypothetical protein
VTLVRRWFCAFTRRLASLADYDASGRARSVAQVYGFLVDRYNGARGLASAPVAGDVPRATAVSADAGTGARGVSNPIVTTAVPAEGSI